MTTRSSPAVGVLLRDWRQRRRLSQLELALEAEVSSRHLSFVETGRARPSRELLLQLADHLDVPLRERNDLLVAAGFAPLYPQSPLESEGMSPVRRALEMVLNGHEPFPAIIVNSHWDLISGNGPATALFMQGVAPEQLEPPVNVLRLSLHPQGLAPRIVNLGELRAHEFARLRRGIAISGDSYLAELLQELKSYPCDQPEPAIELPGPGDVFLPLRIRSGEHELAFFSTLATFGSPLDVTLSELIIESFFPADAATASLFAGAWGRAMDAGNTSPGNRGDA
jgi:transcriptional regulator with XRE-family HTH domain